MKIESIDHIGMQIGSYKLMEQIGEARIAYEADGRDLYAVATELAAVRLCSTLGSVAASISAVLSKYTAEETPAPR